MEAVIYGIIIALFIVLISWIGIWGIVLGFVIIGGFGMWFES